MDCELNFLAFFGSESPASQLPSVTGTALDPDSGLIPETLLNILSYDK